MNIHHVNSATWSKPEVCLRGEVRFVKSGSPYTELGLLRVVLQNEAVVAVETSWLDKVSGSKCSRSCGGNYVYNFQSATLHNATVVAVKNLLSWQSKPLQTET